MASSSRNRQQRRMARPANQPATTHEGVHTPFPEAPPPQEPEATSRQTRTAQILEMLAAESGASITDIGAATGWQAHTSRAFLTGLRKNGHVVARERTEEGARYRLIMPRGEV